MEVGGKMKLSLEEGTCFTQKRETGARNKWPLSDATIGFSNHPQSSQEHGQTFLQCRMEVHLSQLPLEKVLIIDTDYNFCSILFKGS